MIDIPDFTVEARSGGRFHVEWCDDTYRYRFACTADGDVLQRVLPSALRHFPTIYRSEISGRKRIDYLNAKNHDYESLCAGIASRALSRRLFSKALDDRDRRLAERDARAIADKAKFMRELLDGLPSPCTDADLAAAYDRIQNGAY